MTRLYVAGVFLFGVVAFGLAFMSRHDAKVEARQTAKIEKATDNAISKGKRAAAASATPGVLGKRDPSTRDD